MSYPALFATPGMRNFAELVDAERQRQLEKFGDQHHANGTGPLHLVLGVMTAGLAAHDAREICQRHADMGIVTWRDILTEEACEALAEDEPARLRSELVQVAAVSAAWIADLDRQGATR
ncbi:hypothetical protein [Streptomyces spiralis]